MVLYLKNCTCASEFCKKKSAASEWMENLRKLAERLKLINFMPIESLITLTGERSKRKVKRTERDSRTCVVLGTERDSWTCVVLGTERDSWTCIVLGTETARNAWTGPAAKIHTGVNVSSPDTFYFQNILNRLLYYYVSLNKIHL